MGHRACLMVRGSCVAFACLLLSLLQTSASRFNVAPKQPTNPQPPTWSSCAPAGATCTVESVHFDPPQPQANHNNTLSGEGMCTQNFTAGTYDVKLTAMGLPVLTKTGDACSEAEFPLPLGMGTARLTNVHCPQPAGKTTISSVNTIEAVPPGEYKFEYSVKHA